MFRLYSRPSRIVAFLAVVSALLVSTTSCKKSKRGVAPQTPIVTAPVRLQVALGDRVEFTIAATDFDGTALTVMLEPQPLPPNTRFDPTTGLASFEPDTSQVGGTTFFAVASGKVGTTRIPIPVTATARSAGSDTLIGGVVLDSDTQSPIVGAAVSVPGTSLAVRSDQDGRFSIGPIPVGAKVVDIDGGPAGGWTFVAENIELLLGHALYASQVNFVHRPIYLPKLGPVAGTVDPSTNSTLQNSQGVQVTVMAGSAKLPDGTPFSGAMYLPRVDRNFTPAALPDTLEPADVFAIQPAGLTFNPPAAISLPNTNGLPQGSETDIWSIDPVSGEFRVVATGVVQGNMIVSKSGQGVQNSSWHFAEPGGPSGNNGNNPGDNSNPNSCTQEGSSLVTLHTGNLSEEHRLVTYRSLGVERGLTLVHVGRSSCPTPLIAADIDLDRRFATPIAFSSTVELGGLVVPGELFFQAPSQSSRVPQHVARVFDAASLPTGYYPYNLRITSHYPSSRVSTNFFGSLVVHNNMRSPFGCGWSIADLERLHLQVDGTAVIDRGDGQVMAFRPGVTAEPGLVIEMHDIGAVGDVANLAARVPGTFQVFEPGPISRITDRFVVSEVNFPSSRWDTESFFSVGPNGVLDTTRAANEPEGDDRSFQPPGGNDLFGASFSGFIHIPEGGDVIFHVDVDDAFVLRINDAVVMQFLGVTSTRRFTTTAKSLPKGWLPFRLDFAERFINADLVLSASGGGLPGGVVPQKFFATALPQQATETVFAPPKGDFSRLVRKGDGSYERELVDGGKVLYDTVGLQTERLDRNGNSTKYAYDGQRRLVSVTDPVGFVTTLTYGPGGLISSVSHPGSSAPTRLSHQGTDLTEITDSDGTRRQFSYDAEHRLVGQVDKRGSQTAYSYAVGSVLREARWTSSGTSRLYSIARAAGASLDPSATSLSNPQRLVPSSTVESTDLTDRLGNVTHVKTGRLGGLTELVDPLGHRTTMERDVNGLVERYVSPRGRVDTRTYDPSGNLRDFTEAFGASEHRTTGYTYVPGRDWIASVTNADGFVTEFEYDSAGNLLKIKNPDSTERRFEYDTRGLVKLSADENGNETTYGYDTSGRLETVTNALGEITRYDRDGRGNVLRVTEGVGSSVARSRAFTYDEQNRVLVSTDGAGGLTRFVYDANGNLLETVLPTGESISRVFDGEDRLVTLVDPLRGTTSFGYDAERNLTKREDARKLVTAYTYDKAARLKTVTDPLGGVEAYEYDASGNVAAFTNARQKTTKFEFDLLERRIEMATPMGRVRRWSYDRRDNLTNEIQPGNVDIAHTYDNRGRRRSTVVPAVAGVARNTIEFSYDKVGNLRFVTDDDTKLERAYDALNRLREEKTLAGGAQPVTTLTSSYNAVGDRAMLVDSAGGAHTYGRDGAGRLTSVVTSQIGIVSMAYDASGRLRAVSYPNGITGSYNYLANGKLSQITHAPSSGPALVSLTYQVGPSGNIDGINDAGLQKSYGYDPLDRLTKASEIAPTQYDYDQVGNRTQSNLTSAATYNDDNQLLSDDTGTYEYDPRGNLSKYDEAGPVSPQDYRWDAQNQLVEATGVSAYRYDGLGRRVEKVVGSVTRRYVYDGENILLEFDGGNQLLARYTHGEQVDHHLAMVRGGLAFYYHADHLGSVRSMTSSSGAEINRYKYDPYGRVDSVEAVENPFWYTGREEASEIDCYYYRARWYGLRAGRFIGEDPSYFDGSGANWYAYVNARVTTHVDPTGKVGWACVALVIVIAEAILGNPSTANAPGPGDALIDDGFGPELGMATDVALGMGVLKCVPKFVPRKTPRWRLGDHKSSQRWLGQMERRGWNNRQIGEALRDGKRFPAPNNVNPGNSATRYVHPETGRSIVRDNVTGEILQVGGDGFGF